MWLYQLSADLWGPERYRLKIWEGERWNWPVGGRSGGGHVPQPGDTVIFFYAPSGAEEPGFYGLAVVLEWYDVSSSPLYFRPTSPSDFLKMCPWWDDEATEDCKRYSRKDEAANPVAGAAKVGCGRSRWDSPVARVGRLTTQ
jgi:hypothetical protein